MPYTTLDCKALRIKYALETAKSKDFMCSFIGSLPVNIRAFKFTDNNFEISYTYAVDHMDGANKIFYKNEYMAKINIDLSKAEVFNDAFLRTNINYNGVNIVL